MSKFQEYIVLAHIPRKAEGCPYGEVEWVIYDGVYGREQAQAQAERYAKWFHSVQVREVAGAAAFVTL